MALTLRNPHSILAALKSRPKDVLQVCVPSHRGGADLGEGWSQVLELARKHGVQVSQVSRPSGRPDPREQRGSSRPQPRQNDSVKDGRTGAAEAEVREKESISLEELFSNARERAGGHGLWLALDCLQDPHNVGAIFRTAAFFGVQGIVLTEERSAPISHAAYDVAAGGVEGVPFTIQTNLQRAIEVAKDAGLWILGTSEHAPQDLSSVEPDRPWLLVLGNEEKGLRRLTQESCDVLCKVSPKGNVTSLNVSVAAGVFISKLA